MTKKKRAKLIEKAIRLTWSSLESHLRYTHVKSSEGDKFHRKCIREYAELIDAISQLY